CACAEWVAALDHKGLRVLDHAMKGQAIVKALTREKDKAVDVLRRIFWIEVNDDIAFGGLNGRLIFFIDINRHWRQGFVHVRALFGRQGGGCRFGWLYRGRVGWLRGGGRVGATWSD